MRYFSFSYSRKSNISVRKLPTLKVTDFIAAKINMYTVCFRKFKKTKRQDYLFHVGLNHFQFFSDYEGICMKPFLSEWEILLEWSFHIRFMQHAFGEFNTMFILYEIYKDVIYWLLLFIHCYKTARTYLSNISLRSRKSHFCVSNFLKVYLFHKKLKSLSQSTRQGARNPLCGYTTIFDMTLDYWTTATSYISIFIQKLSFNSLFPKQDISDI